MKTEKQNHWVAIGNLIVNKNQSELLARAYGIAESHFFSDDECTVAWQPFEDFNDDELSAQVNDLAESIYQAMLWAQGGHQ